LTPLVRRWIADERGIGKVALVVIIVVIAGLAFLLRTQYAGVIGFLRHLGERLAAGAFW
jgi:hypothetical protein